MRKFFSLLVLALMLTSLSGCDFSANWDLKQAEKALNQADKLNAKFWAEREYTKAQRAFDEAVELNYDGKVNECRDMAQKAREWATEAVDLAQRRIEEMEKEKESLGTYKD